MIVLVQANVLTVGLNGKSDLLRELPIRLTSMRSGIEAARSFKSEKFDSVISKWDLEDMADGLFLKRLKAIKPKTTVVVFVRPGDQRQEIAARCLGVSAVLTELTSDELFLETVTNVLRLDTASVKAIS